MGTTIERSERDVGRGFVVAAVVAVVAAFTVSEPVREGPPPDWYVRACQISDAC